MIRYIPLSEMFKERKRRFKNGFRIIDGDGSKSNDESLEELAFGIPNDSNCSDGKNHYPFRVNQNLVNEGYLVMGALGLNADDSQKKLLLERTNSNDIKNFYSKLFSTGQTVEVYMFKK